MKNTSGCGVSAIKLGNIITRPRGGPVYPMKKISGCGVSAMKLSNIISFKYVGKKAMTDYNDLQKDDQLSSMIHYW